jgi:hypothetical protein
MKCGEEFWVWDAQQKTLYQKEAESNFVIQRPGTLDSLLKFNPYMEFVSHSDIAPEWLPSDKE